MDRRDLENRLRFLSDAGGLKDVMRSGYTAAGSPESTAAHTWRLCLWVLALDDLLPQLDRLRLLEICIVHDLGETLRGDIPAPLQTPNTDKLETERSDMAELLRPLPTTLQSKLMALWEEYEAGETTEARMAKGLDKLETIHQHNDGQNPADFDYTFNLNYGRSKTDAVPLLKELRALVDETTRRRAKEG